MNLDPSHQPTFPLPDDMSGTDENAAADLIRGKLKTIYAQEPDAVVEAIESSQEPAKERSKHQKYMMGLATSGKSFAQIQTEWHDYYSGLDDKEKHEVWQEFYESQGHAPAQAAAQPRVLDPSAPVVGSVEVTETPKPKRAGGTQSVSDIKSRIRSQVQGRSKISRKQHLKSLGFGLGMGAVVVSFLLFGFFNERIIAPFITPSRTVSSTPLILDPTSSAVGNEDKLIIPKINVEVPVIYDVETIEESAIQAGLERGVVNYPTTSSPGEIGNGAIFGHSSNNILNRGQYKFAFILLGGLEKDDTFFIEKGGIRYVYKIFDKKIVSPQEVGVLDDIPGRTSTMTLITCDPPGTNVNRLVIVGEQISPDPAKNIASTAIETDVEPDVLASNSPSLWSRIWGSIF